MAGKKSVEDILSTFPGLLTLTNAGDLSLARGAFTNAISNYMAASQFIRNSRPAGVRRLFNLDASSMQEEQDFRTFLTDMEGSLSAPFGGPGANANVSPNTPFYKILSVFTNHTISLANAFSGGFSLRSVLPTLTTNKFTFIWDSFTNTTLSGVITGLTQTNFDKAFLKVFKAQAQLSIPGVTCAVLGSAPSNLQSSLNGVVYNSHDGNFYGTTPYGGNNGSGAFFKMTPRGTFSLLYSGSPATTSPTGSDNASSLLVGSDGNLYGTTEYSDLYPNGTIFKLTTGGALTGMFKFGQNGGPDEGANGGNPLIQGTDGNFYGTTATGGDNGSGIIFKIASTSPYQFSLLYSFDPATDLNGNTTAGAGALVQGTDGNFYGVTQYGGDFGSGSIFQFIPGSGGNGSQFNTLYSFPTLQDVFGNVLVIGVNNLVRGTNGLFYGTTAFGGTNDLYGMNNNGFNGGGDGAIFSVDAQGDFTSLYSFDQNGFDGFNPIGAMVQGADGAFYGITSSGGANSEGTIFKFTPGAATGFVVWFDKGLGKQQNGLNGYNGGYYNDYTPPVGLVAGAGGIYGTAPNGGVSGNGTVFSLSLGLNLAQGSLQVTIVPSGAVSGGAKWQVDDGPLQNSGTTVSNLSVGNHTVSFNTIFGWITPASQTVSVKANSTAKASGTYVVQPGSLTVNISPPAAITGGAKWQVDGGKLQNSGATVTNLAAGKHTLSFNTISGWITPAKQTVSISNSLTTTASGTYVLQTGSLQVTIGPAPVLAFGAEWQVDYGTWQNSAATVTNLSVGNHTVSFRDIDYWAAPGNQTVSIKANSVAKVTGNYTFNGQGIYNGLFSSDALGVTEETAGLIGNLNVTGSDSYTGKLYLGRATAYSLTTPASFTRQGYSTNVVTTALGKVTVLLYLNASSAPGTPLTITAQVTGSKPTPGWTSAGTLFASLANTSVDAGRYTLLIPPAPTANGTNSPTGYGYALLTNNPGTATVPPSVTITGTLADGTSFSQNVPIGEDNGIPVYQNLYSASAPGLLWGRLYLSNSPALSGFPPLGNLTWIKKAFPSGLFQAGFTNPPMAVQGSPWVPSTPLTNYITPGATLVVSNGGLAAPLAVNVTVNNTNLVATPAVPNFKSGSVNTNTGQLTVAFTNGFVRTGQGAVLQNGGPGVAGGGFFIMGTSPSSSSNPTNAGSIMLMQP